MKKEQDQKFKTQVPELLSDASLADVAGGNTGEPPQPVHHAVRNDSAQQCSSFSVWSGMQNRGVCYCCLHYNSVVSMSNGDPWAGDTLVICELK